MVLYGHIVCGWWVIMGNGIFKRDCVRVSKKCKGLLKNRATGVRTQDLLRVKQT
jgi:hypothetical protein